MGLGSASKVQRSTAHVPFRYAETTKAVIEVCGDGPSLIPHLTPHVTRPISTHPPAGMCALRAVLKQEGSPSRYQR